MEDPTVSEFWQIKVAPKQMKSHERQIPIINSDYGEKFLVGVGMVR